MRDVLLVFVAVVISVTLVAFWVNWRVVRQPCFSWGDDRAHRLVCLSTTEKMK